MSRAQEITQLRENVSRLVGAIQAERDSYLILKERLAELELAQEDVGWLKLGGGSGQEFSRDALTKICYQARLYWLKNPLVKRAVNTQTQYVFGRGINISAPDPLVEKVVNDFWNAPQNKVELTSHQAMTIKETELQIEGNLFFVLFTNGSNGRVTIRSIPFSEIVAVESDPDDRKTPWYYKRCWTGPDMKPREAYYPDWRNERPEKTYKNLEVKEERVYHVKVNCLSDMTFGVSEVYAACDWARAYKEFLENWATIVKSLARFAWKAVAPADVGETIKGVLEDNDMLTNPSPVAGSAAILTPGVDFQPIRTSGATTSAADGQQIIHMVSSATGIFYHYLTGDPSTGNLATAKSMERPMEIMFTDRQTLWRDVITDLLNYVVDQSALAPNGRIPGSKGIDELGDEIITLGRDPETGENIDRTVSVSFPPILEHDMKENVGAVVSAATLDGKPEAGTMPRDYLIKSLLEALGEENAAEITAAYLGEGDTEPEETLASVDAQLTEALVSLKEAVNALR
jgi:hypothetical protein